MTDLTKLAERAEALDGPNRELDAEIALAIGYALRAPGTDEPPQRDPKLRRWYDETGKSLCWTEGSAGFPPYYTTSLDAAMTLVPEGWECFHLFRVSGARFLWEADIGPRLPDFRGNAATPALALVAAALRAKDQANGD